MQLKTVMALTIASSLMVVPLNAEDFYFVTTPARLIGDDQKPVTENIFAGSQWMNPATHPRIVLENEGEAYICNASEFWQGVASDKIQRWQAELNIPAEMPVVAIRAEAADVRGKLLFASWQAEDTTQQISFSLPPDSRQSTRELFLLAKRAHYLRLWQSDIPGGAWFRHQARAVETELGAERFSDIFVARRFFGARTSAMENTYALMSGGRAISENLQLDRELPVRGQPVPNSQTHTVPIDSLTGITIREFDWKPLIKDLQPDLDALASLIPADQHAVFFPSFPALVRFADDTTEAGTPILRFGEPRAEDAMTRQRYEQQLGLSLNQGARLFGPALIRSVAITGGDLYLRTGSDIAILFETTNTAALRTAVEAQIAASVGQVDGVEKREGERAVPYRGYVTADRRVCSYVAVVGDAVAVTNSLVQLERIVQTMKQPQTSLAKLDEYVFFRHRYPRGDKQETALAIISDPTIRRWCGPKWRIATSRRTRATAVMAELQAQHLADFVASSAENRTLESPFSVSDAKSFVVDSRGLRSEVYGNLKFQTPILELDLVKVTPEEADLYNRWRATYQQNWSNFFDPIAVRFCLSDKLLEADVTVMPLIDGSQYNFVMAFSKGAELTATSGDRHREALLYAMASFNPNSEQSRSALNLTSIIGLNAGSWIGKSASFYIDEDPVLQELVEWRKANKEKDIDEELAEQFLHRLPVAIHIDASNGLKLTAFLTALRTYIEQTAPGMTVWEVRQHGEEPYVRVGLSDRARSETPDEIPDELAIYYAASGRGLTVTLNENVLKRALDRRVADRSEPKSPEAKPGSTDEPLGNNLALDVDRGIADMISELTDREYQRTMQRLCWNNLPILNEWKHDFPNEDAVRLHQEHWGVRLVCPGGGEYRWNDEAHTFESTVYGHPGAPKTGPKLPTALLDVQRARFGLSLEEHGIRARVQLHKAE